jgi:hypothetical protein
MQAIAADVLGERYNMPKLTDEERRLLQQLSERERIVSGLQRPQGIQRLVDLGYVREESLNIQDLRFTITDAGRGAAAPSGPSKPR